MFDLVGQGAKVVAPRHAYNGSIMQLGDLEARGRLTATLVDITDTEAVVAACDDAALVWLESPTNPALEVADIETIAAAAHDAGAYVVVDNTFATPLLQRPLDLGADLVVHSATKYLSGHSDVLLGAVITGDDELFGVLKGRRDLVGAIPGTLEAWLALRGLRTLHLRGRTRAGERAGAGAPAGRPPGRLRGTLPRFRGDRRDRAGPGRDGRRPAHTQDKLWVHATSLGGVESTFERRRRWKTEAATIPEGLVRMSVGIEDVEDLWHDLVTALDDLA